MKNILKLAVRIFAGTLVFLLTLYSEGFSQNNLLSDNSTAVKDSLSLRQAIGEVVKNHPLVKKTYEMINSADAKIGLAKTAYYPNIDVKLSFTNIGPVQKITMPGMGVFQLYPENNYNAVIDLNENIYDFGKTSKRIDLAMQGKHISEESLEIVKQKLSLAVVQIYYNLLFLQHALEIKDREIATLNEHLSILQKKEQTGSATRFEILSTKVNISNSVVQKDDIESRQKIMLAKLNLLMGRPVISDYAFNDSELNIPVQDVEQDSLLAYSYENRTEMKIAEDKIKLQRMDYSLINAQTNPMINFFGNAGYKNGFLPDLNKMTANYVVGIGFNYPLFDAFRTRQRLMAADNSINEAQYDADAAKRKISDEVIESRENFESSKRKLVHLQLNLKQAEDALALAEVSFKSGAVTNLELLDASTKAAESRLMLLKAKIDYVIDFYQLKAAIGNRLY